MRLYLLNFGTMQPGNIPVCGYLIQADDGKNVLVDTGWPRSYVTAPRHPPGLTLDIAEEDTVTARLDSIGLSPDDIDLLICSHLDDDHSGNHDLFTGAELIVQRKHLELARSGHPRFAGNRDAWDHPDLNYRMIEGDQEVLPGVEVIETSGHVPGHQSLLVRLPETGPVLLAIDAVMDQSMAEPEEREIWITDWAERAEDVAQIRASTRKLAQVASRERTGFTVYGHDARQWPTLLHAPSFYA